MTKISKMFLSSPFLIHPQSDPGRGQVHNCHNRFATCSEKQIAHVNENFSKNRKTSTRSLSTSHQ